MMELLDCYLPVFKLARQVVYQPEDFDDYDIFRGRCIALLEQAIQDAGYQDVSDFEREQALFAVVVWLDEILLCSVQPFAQLWRTDLLQRRYFQTYLGGEEFFYRLDELKEEHLQVRRIFLFCLQNGFHGKYSEEHEQSKLSLLIERQRQYCLPESWQKWPNNAPLTPVLIRKRTLTPSPKYRAGLAVLFIAMAYVAILIFQAFYFK